MDEPSTGLDVLAKEYMLSVVRELAANTGITILYVTHYAEEIQPLFQRSHVVETGPHLCQRHDRRFVSG